MILDVSLLHLVSFYLFFQLFYKLLSLWPPIAFIPLCLASHLKRQVSVAYLLTPGILVIIRGLLCGS